MGSLGGESQGWWGLRYLALLPSAVHRVGQRKCVAHAQTVTDAAASFTSPDTQRSRKNVRLERDQRVFTP